MSSNAVFSSFLLLLSHPLYTSYFIFFLPYILALLQFLSPLFFTTFLLFFASSLSGSPEFMHPKDRPESAHSKMGFLSTTYQVIYDSLRPRVSEGNEDMCPRFEELEAYKMVFESYTFETSDIPAEVEIRVDKSCASELGRADKQLIHGIKDSAGDQERQSNNSGGIKTKTVTKKLPCKMMETQGAEPDKVEDKCRSSSERGSKAKDNRVNGFERGEEETALKVAEDNSEEKESNLASFGSMRREREWRRTLACKLFEERQNVNGSEGMDKLWETYEKQSDKAQSKSNSNRIKVKESGKEEAEEEEEDMQMCCLQALKFSGGKTNLGMGRTNVVKISKALKGMGWFNQHAKIKGPR